MRLSFTNVHQFSSKMASFQIRSAPQVHTFSQIFVETCQFSKKECASVSLIFNIFHKFSSKIASFQKRTAPQFHRFSQNFVETCQFSNKECASVSLIFTNFRRKLPVFKKGVRLNFTDYHKISSKLASFQIRSAPQFHKFSQVFVKNY